MIAIIDYDAGNLTSVARAISFIGYDNMVTNDPEKILSAERVIFPGVGSAGSAMESLKRLQLDKTLHEVFQKGMPLLGICLGTQIILSMSQEHNTQCLGIMEGNVPGFKTDMKDHDDTTLKIPHMGWNRVKINKQHPVLSELKSRDEFYFVHSYYPAPEHLDHIIGTSQYGIDFPSIIGFKNLIATQFHPEKSGRAGLSILKNFCEWIPC